MTPEQWEKISDIFHSAAALEPAKRAAFLDDACAGDTTLRDEVESLLSAHDQADDFIDKPAVQSMGIHVSEMPSLTGAFFSHYRIEKSIGKGGMGHVYLATDLRLNRRVALKKLPDRFAVDPLFIKRFRNEAHAAATLNHPNVATIYSVEEEDGKPFISMEYVEGQTLETLVPEEGLPIKTFLDWFIRVSDALLHAHENGVTHRDIKPGNIMISPGGTPKILDFGLAQMAGDALQADGDRSSITLPGQIIGTPAYMSPEQAKAKDVDHRSDIFSLGVVMYEALTGKRPFTGESNAELISNLLKSDPRPVSKVRADVPPIVARMIDRCLRKSRRDRVQSMLEIRSALEEANTVISGGISTGSLGRRLYRETVWGDWRWGAAAVILAIAVGVSGWYYFSGPRPKPPISFDKMTMRKLSQSNNVGGVAITPDGRSIVYLTAEDNGERSLWIRRIDDANALLLVPPQAVQYWSRPVISDDGGQVYFLIAGRAATHGTIFRVSTLGGQPRKLVDAVNHLSSLSPDGQRIFYTRLGDQNQLLSANASDGSDERPIITSETNEIAYREARFSADGKTIYAIKRGAVDAIEYWALVSFSPDGSGMRELFRQKELLGELCTLPDPNGLLISAIDPATNLKQIFHYSLIDGTRTRVTNDLMSYYGVTVDRSGRNIATTQSFDAYRVFVGEAGNLSKLRPLTREPNAYGNVDWTPDGKVVFDATENNKSHIWITDLSGRTPQQLTSSDHDNAQPKVSGDGRFIVFTTNRAGFNQVWRMNIDGSGQVLLADVTGITEAPRFMADRETVVFNWFHDGQRTLARIPVTGGAVETVFEMPSGYSYYWAMSPDGRKIAYTYRDEAQNRSKVGIRDIDSSEPFAILNVWPSGFLKWTPDSASIFYHEREGTLGVESKVMQMAPSWRSPKVMLETAPEIVPDLTFSRDGKMVAAVRGKGIADAVLLTALGPEPIAEAK